MGCSGLLWWRQWRLPVIDFTVFDFGLFILAVALLGELLHRWRGDARIYWWGMLTVGGLLLGVITHWALGIPTVLGWVTGLSAYPPRPIC